MLIILILIIAIFNSQMDVIRFKTNKAWFQNDFWLAKNKYDESKRSWIMMNPLSFISDGWHVCKFIVRLAECYALSMFTNYNPFLEVIIIYILIGVIFEIFYNI